MKPAKCLFPYVAGLFLFSVLGISGCQIPGTRSSEPATELPSTYQSTSNSASIPNSLDMTGSLNSGLLSVTDFYKDPVLSGLISEVLTNNRNLKILDEEIIISENEILSRRGAYLPSLSLGATGGLERPGKFTRGGAVEEQLLIMEERRFPNPLGSFGIGLNMFFPIDLWREYRNARDAAIERYFAAIDQRNDLIVRLVADTATEYYKLLALDRKLENINKIIEIQEQSLELAKARKEAARDTELPVQRFLAEVRKNQSEKLLIQQEITEAENRVNVLAYRNPQRVERTNSEFDLTSIPALDIGLPSQLLSNRPDIKMAEREVIASGLDVEVARAQFFPKVDVVAGIGWEAFNPKYLFYTPESLAYNLAGNLLLPLVNRAAIKAEYMNANARQLQAIYEYQRVILASYAEVINNISMAENYRKSFEVKKTQIDALVESVDVANKLFQNARVEYVEVLLAQRDLLEARLSLIELRKKQLSAIVAVYQALGGGSNSR